MKIKLADYVISWLSSKGVKTVFTEGGGSIVLCDALFDQSKIRYICCHHEQSVAFAVEGVSGLERFRRRFSNHRSPWPNALTDL